MLNRIEKIFTVISLILLSSAIISLVPSGQTGDYNIGIKLLYIAIYIISFIFIIIKKTLVNKIIKSTYKQNILILFTLLVIASILWSDNHVITAQRALAFLGTILFATYFSIRYNQKEQINLLSYACAIIILLSYLVVFLMPSYGLSADNPGAWQGVFNQKNVLGRMMVLSTITLIFYNSSEKNYLKKYLAGTLILASIGLIIFSQAKTAMILVIFMIICLYFLRLIQKNKNKTAIALSCIILILAILTGIFLVAYSDNILNDLNKDSTLTGRTTLWQLSLEKINEKQLLGYGYNSFWLGYAGPSKDIWFSVEWEPPNAHNGFIDILLELGITGLLVFIILFISSITKSFYFIKHNNNLINLWPIFYLVFTILYNLTESILFRQNSIFFALFIVTLYNLEKEKTV